MKRIRNIHMLIICLFFCYCKTKEISDHVLKLNECKFIDYKAGNCEKVEYRDFVINISHQCFSEQKLSKYTLLISFDGTVYKGPFKKDIRIKSIPVCKHEGRNVVGITVALIDSTQNKVFIWQNENTYILNKFSNLSITLKPETTYNVDDGAFDIKKW